MAMSPAEWIPPCSARLHRPRLGAYAALLAFLLLLAPAIAAQDSSETAQGSATDEEASTSSERGSERTPAAQPREGVEEIIVEGTGADDSLQDTAISGTRFDAQEMRSLRIRDIEDVADYTPNLEIATAFAASNPTIFIRGIWIIITRFIILTTRNFVTITNTIIIFIVVYNDSIFTFITNIDHI